MVSNLTWRIFIQDKLRSQNVKIEPKIFTYLDLIIHLIALHLVTPVFFYRHLVRLPKTTPEGYKVLLYSVRDTDYTKLVFSDAVKGFCMFNDCVLSEDGLAEG